MKARCTSAPGSTQQIIGTKLGYDSYGAWFASQGNRVPMLKRRFSGSKGSRRRYPLKVTLAGQA